MITAAQLNAAGIAPTQAASFVDALNAAMLRFDIVTPPRVAAFVGQCMVESSCFVHTEENLFYSNPQHLAEVFPREFPTAADAMPYARNPAKLGAKVYAGRLGNGDEASGEGYLYRGRGLLQITGKANYASAGAALGTGYLLSPDLVALPDGACMTACWFWDRADLNRCADAGAIDAITKAINGPGMQAAPLRRQYTQQVLAVLA